MVGNKDCLVGIDIGGTFTDFVLIDKRRGMVFVEKQRTDHRDLSSTVFNGLDFLLGKANLTYEDLRYIFHATTLATNALIEKKGAKTGLICTKGHTDVLEIRTGARYDLYDLNIQFHPPLIPRYLRRGVNERILPNGSILVPLDDDEVRTVVKDLVEKQGVTSIAVCLLHSYSNSSHEKRIEEIIRREFPEVHVSISSQISPKISEYERMTTTIVNAYVQPIVSGYINKMLSELNHRGFVGSFYIMTCWGGLVEPDIAKQYPVVLLESGPVAGALIASYLGKIINIKDVFGFDMGGTTAKGCVIKDGIIEKDYKFEAARIHHFKAGSGIPVMVPTVKLIEIGGGGGSIAWVDDRGAIKIGPRSAGSYPGPACYGLGGEEPTVTDADLLLGYLNPNYFLGGRIKLWENLARKALENNIAARLGVDVHLAAWAIYEKISEDIAAAFRIHSAERGIDIRRFNLLVFGGSGPIHGVSIARRLGVRKVIFPIRAGVLSACGLLVTPLQFSIDRSYFIKLSQLDPAEYEKVFQQIIQYSAEILKKAGVPQEKITISRKLDMRYEGQGFDIEVDDPYDGKFTDVEKLKQAFENRYREIYFMSGVAESIEITGFKVTVSGPIPEVELFKPIVNISGEALKGYRECFFGESLGFVKTSVYDRYKLATGITINGPAIVEEAESTCVIPPGFKASVDVFGNIIVEMM